MKVFSYILALCACISYINALADNCDVSDSDKIDCGHMGTNQQECEAANCCWRPVDPNPNNLPWCFYGSDHPDSCKEFLWEADGPGFTREFYDTMFENYRANLNVEDCGAVVAAPDKNTPGGSYYYHWMRDAGLSIKSWMDLNDNDYSLVKEVLEGYVHWVGVVQQKDDPNNIDVRIEPKFEIPSGDPYTGGWCRPQTDGPALRGMALSKWGFILADEGQIDTARNDVWPKIKFDMEWVTANWDSEGCDLWEEVRSRDFFWNRMGFVYSLNVAADFADRIGDNSMLAQQYRDKAAEILESAKGHWNGEFIYETMDAGRQQDGSVIHAIATFGEYLYGPSSDEAAATIATYAKTFCREYKINQDDNNNGEPGVLIGRYPGDSYAGGNPWQLLTAVLAETFYLGAQSTFKSIEVNAGLDYTIDVNENRNWIKLLDPMNDGHIKTARDLATAQLAAGDSVMTRLWKYVNSDDGRIDEQIDKNTGAQTSAQGLTWSYANILHALKIRFEGFE